MDLTHLAWFAALIGILVVIGVLAVVSRRRLIDLAADLARFLPGWAIACSVGLGCVAFGLSSVWRANLGSGSVLMDLVRLSGCVLAVTLASGSVGLLSEKLRPSAPARPGSET